MELRTFVKTALLDIVGGITDAQQLSLPGTIVPEMSDKLSAVEKRVTRFQVVDFEVSVRAEESKGSEAKLGVVNSMFGIGAGVASNAAKEQGSASVIRFSVPLRLPMQPGQIQKETRRYSLEELDKNARGAKKARD